MEGCNSATIGRGSRGGRSGGAAGRAAEPCSKKVVGVEWCSLAVARGRNDRCRRLKLENWPSTPRARRRAAARGGVAEEFY